MIHFGWTAILQYQTDIAQINWDNRERIKRAYFIKTSAIFIIAQNVSCIQMETKKSKT